MSPIDLAINRARKSFASRKTESIEWRKEQLNRLMDLLNENEHLFVQSVFEDMKKPRYEAIITDVEYVRNELRNMLFNLDSYVSKKPQSKTLVTMFDQIYTVYEPLGTILVLGTWNYPVQVLLVPLLGAIGAGCTAVLKPSEVAPATAALMEQLIPKYLDNDAFVVVNGGPEVSQALLKEKFDFIFYTGSGNIAKHVARAAAEHLTPTCLELGGKSPVYFDSQSLSQRDQLFAVRRILWGKWVNGGQTCIAPDYVITTKKGEEDFMRLVPKVLKMFGPDGTEQDRASIVTNNHFARLEKMLETTKGVKHVAYGTRDFETRHLPLTIVRDITLSDPVMQEEIFGPILPILTVSNVEEAVDMINGRDKPLTLYIFSNDQKVVDSLIGHTSSGGVCVNDTILQMSVDALPFGGVGASGMGAYHGFHTFTCFSHQKSVLHRNFNPILEWVAGKRYPPYKDNHMYRLMRLTKKRDIPNIPLKSIFLIFIGFIYGHFIHGPLFQ